MFLVKKENREKVKEIIGRNKFDIKKCTEEIKKIAIETIECPILNETYDYLEWGIPKANAPEQVFISNWDYAGLSDFDPQKGIFIHNSVCSRSTTIALSEVLLIER